jgi:hypothetical protein
MPILAEKEADWQKCQDINDDPYGKAIVDVVRKAMELLDQEEDTPIDPHALITRAEEAAGADGITGYMAGCVAGIISQCHSRGKEFNSAWNKSYGVEEETEGTVNPALVTIEVSEDAVSE